MLNTSISPDYFFDYMNWDEVNAILEEYNNQYKNEWEKIRWSAYINALGQGVKLKKPTDLIEFEWERKKDIDVNQYSKDELQRRQERLVQAKQERQFKTLTNLSQITK